MSQTHKVLRRSRDIPLHEEPKEERDLQRFFIHTYLIVAAAFFITAITFFFLKEAAFMREQVFIINNQHEEVFRYRIFFILGSIFIVFPMYQLMAFYRSSRTWLYSILFLYPVIFGYYFTLLIILLRKDVMTAPFLSAGCAFAIAAGIGLASDRLFYLKAIGWLRLIIGISCMFLLHKILHAPFTAWLVAIPLFWIYDFIAADSQKLIYVTEIKNPELDYTQQVLFSSISVLLAIPLTYTGPHRTMRVQRKWVTKWDE